MEADPLAPVQLAVKLALYISALLAAGLALHASLGIVDHAGRGRALRSAALLGALALVFAALRLAVANIQLGGALNSVFDAATLAWTWPNLSASSMAFALGGSLLLVAWPFRATWLAAFAAASLAAGFGLTGHTQGLDAPGLAPWAVGLHVLIAAFWTAAPLTLWPRDRLSNETIAGRVERFSRLAVIVVPLLFGIGVWLTILLSGGFAAVASYLYGQLLLAKLAVATAALALGAYNKQVVTRKLRETPETGRRALIATLGLDLLLFTGALALVGVATTLTGPPAN